MPEDAPSFKDALPVNASCESALQSTSDKPASGSTAHLGKRQNQVLEAIASLVQALPQGTHLTAPEVHNRARQVGLSVSLSAVYRALNALKEQGNVATLSGDRGLRYEATAGGHDHDHLICLKCGLTIEFVDELIHGFGKLVAQRKGYEHRSSRFDILGICSDCKAKDEDHQIKQAIQCLDQVIVSARLAIAQCQSGIAALQLRKGGRAAENIIIAGEKLNEAILKLNEAGMPSFGKNPDKEASVELN